MEPIDNGTPQQQGGHWLEKAPVPLNVTMESVQDMASGTRFLAMTFNTADVTATFFIPQDAVIRFAKDVERKAAEVASDIVVPGGPRLVTPE